MLNFRCSADCLGGGYHKSKVGDTDPVKQQLQQAVQQAIAAKESAFRAVSSAAMVVCEKVVLKGTADPEDGDAVSAAEDELQAAMASKTQVCYISTGVADANICTGEGCICYLHVTTAKCVHCYSRLGGARHVTCCMLLRLAGQAGWSLCPFLCSVSDDEQPVCDIISTFTGCLT